MEQITGIVSHVIYHNDHNSYTVFELESEGEEVTCTGHLPSLHEGDGLKVSGAYVEHPSYGRQFRVDAWEVCAPEDREAVFRYLSSGAVKGIGEGLARRIIRKFGDDTMRVLDEEPERLSEVRGISARMAREIAAQMEENRDQRDAFIFLQKYGISGRQAVRVYETYGTEIYSVLKTDPYRLAEDIQGIGFARADEIAARAGIQPDSDFRIRSGLTWILTCALQEGSCYLPEPVVLDRAAALLRVDRETLELQLENLVMDGKIRIQNPAPTAGDSLQGMPSCAAVETGTAEADDAATGCAGNLTARRQVYLSSVFYTEQRAARRLLSLDRSAAPLADRQRVLAEVQQLEEEEGIELDDLQKEAIVMAAAHGTVLICGGPGTGKTTTINTMIRLLRHWCGTILLAAPTGRAARRMTEATGVEAMTIHRMLGYQPDPDAAPGEEAALAFEHTEDNPLEADAVIVDEMSMVDLFLFDALVRALSPGTRLIMVGDADQLPSVGPGRVLRDLLSSGAIHTVMLHRIFRQAARSDIVMNAHRILQGAPLKLDNHSSDFFLLERSDPNVIYKHICLLLSCKLPPWLHCSSTDIQVLSPMKKGPLGTIRLNEVLQSVLNPPAPGRREYQYRETVFREGDKVMQTRNDYQLHWEVPGNFNMPLEEGEGIFNGDAGTILSVDTGQQEMLIRFDENRQVRYPFSSLDDLELAYAITVHKAQGSEYPAVILPLLGGPRTLFCRSLLYTAITRARSCVVILGSRATVQAMEDNLQESVRYTGLEERIRELADPSDPAMDPPESADSSGRTAVPEAVPGL